MRLCSVSYIQSVTNVKLSNFLENTDYKEPFTTKI